MKPFLAARSPLETSTDSPVSRRRVGFSEGDDGHAMMAELLTENADLRQQVAELERYRTWRTTIRSPACGTVAISTSGWPRRWIARGLVARASCR
jgi:hypothetical protein